MPIVFLVYLTMVFVLKPENDSVLFNNLKINIDKNAVDELRSASMI